MSNQWSDPENFVGDSDISDGDFVDTDALAEDIGEEEQAELDELALALDDAEDNEVVVEDAVVVNPDAIVEVLAERSANDDVIMNLAQMEARLVGLGYKYEVWTQGCWGDVHDRMRPQVSRSHLVGMDRTDAKFRRDGDFERFLRNMKVIS